MTTTLAEPPIKVTPALLERHNLTRDSYQRIKGILRREPTLTELGMFGVMHSEHCSYCSSKIYLKKLPTEGKGILVPAGAENAGVVDIGKGWAVVFKIESHNHPSAVEPHEGAATGVGGILRDIFTMGARPIALLNSLRFGPLDTARTRFLVSGVVKGIADYGNCMGIPTVAGEVVFDSTYQENPLVNAMCIGLVRREALAKAAARGIGNPVFYVGSKTGRDGLGGASFASRELTEGSEADRPAVQVGDPFTEKLLLEATLEALATGDVVGIQDMGAAGLTCATCETAGRGGVGVEIELSRVPQREQGMTPYEIMLSESQERMLLIVRKGRERAIQRIFEKWDLDCVAIGTVTKDGKVRVRHQGQVVAQIPAAALTDRAPVYRRPLRRPRYLAQAQSLDLKSVREPGDYTDALHRLLDDPTIAQKRWVYEQYDHMVRTSTTALPGAADAAVLRLKEAGGALATSVDGNGAYCYLDPYEGGKLAVAEAARNVACVGATPLAVTNCLNFGNPEDPEVMWQFAQCVRGMSEACRALGTPVTGGNVSFYNEHEGRAIDPTPVIGMVGLIEGARGEGQGAREPITANFKHEGDIILLLGETLNELGGSRYLQVIHGLKRGLPPRVNLTKERAVQHVVIDCARKGWLRSAHDCSDGGLAVTLAECCITDPEHLIGATVSLAPCLPPPVPRIDALLFGESASRVVVSCEPQRAPKVQAACRKARVRCAVIGRVGGRRLTIGPWIRADVESLSRNWREAIACRMTV